MDKIALLCFHHHHQQGQGVLEYLMRHNRLAEALVLLRTPRFMKVRSTTTTTSAAPLHWAVDNAAGDVFHALLAREGARGLLLKGEVAQRILARAVEPAVYASAAAAAAAAVAAEGGSSSNHHHHQRGGSPTNTSSSSSSSSSGGGGGGGKTNPHAKKVANNNNNKLAVREACRGSAVAMLGGEASALVLAEALQRCAALELMHEETREHAVEAERAFQKKLALLEAGGAGLAAAAAATRAASDAGNNLDTSSSSSNGGGSNNSSNNNNKALPMPVRVDWTHARARERRAQHAHTLPHTHGSLFRSLPLLLALSLFRSLPLLLALSLSFALSLSSELSLSFFRSLSLFRSLPFLLDISLSFALSSLSLSHTLTHSLTRLHNNNNNNTARPSPPPPPPCPPQIFFPKRKNKKHSHKHTQHTIHNTHNAHAHALIHAARARERFLHEMRRTWGMNE